MKKILFLTLASACGLLTANAQEKVEVSPETFTFQPHWFTQVQVGGAYTRGESSFGDLISPAAAINAGYKFNKLFAVRGGFGGWQARGSWANPQYDYKFNYLQLNVDAMLDLCNLFGYNHKRFFDAYIFAGAGANIAFNNSEAVALQHTFDNVNFAYLWDDSKFFTAGRLGLGADFRINDRFSVNVEANANIMSDKFNSKKAGNPDWQFNALVGVKINLGKTYKHSPAVYKTVEPEPQPVVEPKPEPVVVTPPAPKKEVVKAEPIRRDINFSINKYNLSKTETAKLDEVVAYMNKYPQSKASITGYADKDTGNARINLHLSEKRSEAAKNYLVSKGISADRITASAKGDTIQPFSNAHENRVSICIAQ